MACLKLFSTRHRSTLMPPWPGTRIPEAGRRRRARRDRRRGGDPAVRRRRRRAEAAASPAGRASRASPTRSPALYDGIRSRGSTSARRTRRPRSWRSPTCSARSARSTRATALPTVVRDYVRTGKVRYELHFRSFLGRDSVRAAGAAAEAAKQDRMYQFADVFYRNQGPEESGLRGRGLHAHGRRPGRRPGPRQGRRRRRRSAQPARGAPRASSSRATSARPARRTSTCARAAR